MLNFLQPAWFALALLVIPVLLLHMRKRKTITVGSVRIWRSVGSRAGSGRSFRFPPLTLPLLLQLLAVLLLTLVLTQPVINFTRQAADHVIYVLDTSNSMQVRGDYQAALDHVSSSLPNPAASRVSLLTSSGEAPVVLARVATASAAQLGTLPSAATDAEPDWQRVVLLTSGLIRPDEDTRVILLTAGSTLESSKKFTELAATVSTLAFNATPAPYLQQVRVTPQEAAGSWTLDGSLVLPDDAPEQIGFSIWFRTLDDSDYLLWAEHELDTARLKQNTAQEHVFSLPLQLPRAGVVRVELDAAGSRSFSFVLHPEPVGLRVLFRGTPDHNLLRALTAVPGVSAFTGEGEAENFDLIVTNALPIDGTNGGNLLILPALIDDAEITAPLLSGWSANHPLSEGVAWGGVSVERASRMPLLEGGQVVLEGNGVPLVQARTTHAGREVALAFNPANSNWAQLSAFPAFIANVLQWIEPDLGLRVARSCEAGSPCRVGAGQLGAGVQLSFEDGAPLELVQAGEGILEYFVTEQAGVIWAHSEGAKSRPLAVNPPPLPRLTASSTDASAEVPARAPLRLWFPLALVLLAVLLIEAGLTFLPVPPGITGVALRRRNRAVALRGFTLVLVAVSLLQPRMAWPQLQEQLVVLLPAGQQERYLLLPRLAAATKTSRRGQELAVIDSAAVPRVTLDFREPWSAPGNQAAGANLQAALDLAIGLLDPGAPGRILVASGGIQTHGDVRALLKRLPGLPVTVDVLPLSGAPAGEVHIGQIRGPDHVYTHDRFTLRATVHSEGEADARISLLRDGEILISREQRLLAGSNLLEFLISADESGEVLFEVLVEADGDTFPENNRDGLLIDVSPPGRVLVITLQEEWGATMADALRLQGLEPVVVAPARAPYYLADWLEFSGFVLLDVPALELQVLQQELLEEAVGEHGRGLLILGGPNTYGPGGYFETALERLSPLSSDVPRDAPNAALVFVLDRSGSMQQQVGDMNRLDIAREATLTAARLLHEETRSAIVVFDSEATLLVPLQEQLDLLEIEEALRFLEPGGGTVLYPGLVLALEQLRGVDSASRHIIVMSDGLSQPGDFEGILKEITDEGITVSTVAIGEGADTRGLQNYARLGGGAFHASRDFRALPGILAQESMMLSGVPIEEFETQPTWVDRSPAFLAGLPDELPPVAGFVLTTPKDEATVHISVPAEDGEDYPLLASWRFGNGQVLAFTSQGAGSWTQQWLATPEFPLFWSQALRAFLPAAPQPGINVQADRSGDELDLIVSVLDSELAALTGLTVSADGRRLTEDGRGAHRGTITARPDTGTIEVTAGDEEAFKQLHVGYPAAYNFSSIDFGPLELLAAASNGTVRKESEPLFAGGQRFWKTHALWPALIVAAAVLLLTELLIRYSPGLTRKEPLAWLKKRPNL